MKNKKNESIPYTDPESIIESISDGVFTVDNDWRITSFNRAAEAITGIDRSEAIGMPCSEVLRASVCEESCALRQTMESGKPVINRETFIVDAEGARIPISVSTAILRDSEGNAVGGAETFRDMTLVEELRRELKGQSQLGDLVSRSESMKKIIAALPDIAASDSTLLIQGETGTGKELLARTVHHLSRRRNEPFVAVNCGALPDTLLESELFGYRKGAFTGADRDKPGRFALAEGGSLFLDEIGDVSPALQVRLLRVLQERFYEPLGGTKPIPLDVRVIAATNKILSAEVERGNFRRDLFYRIHVVCIDLPPLRKRKEDIPWLIDRFVARFNLLQGKAVSGVKPEVVAALMAHDFPGNIRELENIVEHGFVHCATGWMDFPHLPEPWSLQIPLPQESLTMESSVKALEIQAIQAALRKNVNNRTAAATELGIHKTTLYRKIKNLGIPLPERDGRWKD